MKIIIRRAEIKDIKNMARLAALCIEDSIPPTRDVSLKNLKQARILDIETSLGKIINLSHVGIYLAEDEKGTLLGHLMGYVGDIESVTGEAQGWIFDLSVDPKYRRRGIARKLVEKFTEFVKKAGYNFIGLLVTSSNKAAVALYENLGFVEERKRMAKRVL